MVLQWRMKTRSFCPRLWEVVELDAEMGHMIEVPGFKGGESLSAIDPLEGNRPK